MISVGDSVDVYWNLHRDLFSVRSRRRSDYGRVIGHVERFHLTDVSFVVNEAGRQRVLRERRKNVHAFVRGLWAEDAELRPVRVSYNPYRAPSFLALDQPAVWTDEVCGAVNLGHPLLTM